MVVVLASMLLIRKHKTTCVWKPPLEEQASESTLFSVSFFLANKRGLKFK